MMPCLSCEKRLGVRRASIEKGVGCQRGSGGQTPCVVAKANREAAAWFHLLLMKHQIAAPARDYLKSRGINGDMANLLADGLLAGESRLFTAGGWRNFQVTDQIMVEAGIFSVADQDEQGRGGRSYPRWRHRLMFPIRNDNGT